jgi:hypothetical protein
MITHTYDYFCNKIENNIIFSGKTNNIHLTFYFFFNDSESPNAEIICKDYNTVIFQINNYYQHLNKIKI